MTGLERSLLSTPVAASYHANVAGATVDLFLLVVLPSRTTGGYPGRQPLSPTFASTDELNDALQAAYRPVELALVLAEPLHVRCPPTQRVNGSSALRAYQGRPDGWRLRHADQYGPYEKVLPQWIGLRKVYDLVAQVERRRGWAYRWLVRTRTDVVHLERIRYNALDPEAAYVPLAGMNRDPRAMCTNDHIFICPRGLCRPYFHLLEIFDSSHCVPWFHRTQAQPLIFATEVDGKLTPNSLPAEPYSIPPIPQGVYPSTEWYMLARYVREGSACNATASGANASAAEIGHQSAGAQAIAAPCCGLIRELRLHYAIARGGSATGNIQCAAYMRGGRCTPRKLRTSEGLLLRM